MVKVRDIRYQCNDAKITRIELNKKTNNIYMSFLYVIVYMETFKGHWTPFLVSELLFQGKEFRMLAS